MPNKSGKQNYEGRETFLVRVDKPTYLMLHGLAGRLRARHNKACDMCDAIRHLKREAGKRRQKAVEVRQKPELRQSAPVPQAAFHWRPEVS